MATPNGERVHNTTQQRPNRIDMGGGHQVIPGQHLAHVSGVGGRLQAVPISWQRAYAVPAVSAIPAVVSPNGVLGEKKPRPRKPYTTTKAREMWTPEEHSRMLEGLKRYKRDWTKVTAYVGTRSAAQVRSHAQKYFDRVQRDKTNDYVPQARPKRKSSSPYPRKMRPEQQQQLQVHPPTSPTLHVPAPPGSIPATPQYYSLSPHTTTMYPAIEGYPTLPLGATILAPNSPYQYPIHHAMYPPGAIPHPHQHPQHIPSPAQMHHVPHPHHPQFIIGHPAAMMPTPAPPPATSSSAPPTGPVVSSARPSPVLSSPATRSQLVRVHHPGGPAPTGVPVAYSPVPHGAVRVARMIPHSYPATTHHPSISSSLPSPMSVDVAARSYPPHGMMVHPQQHYPTMITTAAAAPMSPLTPYPAVGASPVPDTYTKNNTKEKGLYVPQHSHPNGPDPNCAKCIALKRYGNVFQEIGALRNSAVQRNNNNANTAPGCKQGKDNVKGAAMSKMNQSENNKIGKKAKKITNKPTMNDNNNNIESDCTVKSGEGSEERRDMNEKEAKEHDGDRNEVVNDKKGTRGIIITALGANEINKGGKQTQQMSFTRIAKAYDASRPHHTIGPNGKKQIGSNATAVGDESGRADRNNRNNNNNSTGKTVSSIAKVLTTDLEPTVGTKRGRSTDNSNSTPEKEDKYERRRSKKMMKSGRYNSDFYDAVKSLQNLGTAAVIPNNNNNSNNNAVIPVGLPPEINNNNKAN